MAGVESRIIVPRIDSASEYSEKPHSLGSRIPHETIPDALEAWRKGDDNHLITAEIFGNKERVGIGALKYLALWLDRTEVPHVWVAHDSMNLQEKETMFGEIQPQVAPILNSSEPIRPIKTVTLKIPSTPSAIVAVTGLGRNIDNKVRAAIATDLTESTERQVSTKTAKKATINPPNDVYDTTVFLGLQPGVVGPLVEPFNVNSLDAWYYMNELLDDTTPAELALSLHDSLIMNKRSLEDFLFGYKNDYLHMDTFKHLSTKNLL